jgi:hypothetical protein
MKYRSVLHIAAVLAALVAASSASRPLDLAPALAAVTGSGASCDPAELHLALTGNFGEMRVSWTTFANGCPPQVSWRPVGSGPDASGARSVLGQTRSLDPEDMCSSPASTSDWGPVFLHSAVMTGLAPGGKYEYMVARGREWVRFSAAPAPGADASLRFVAFGDMGESKSKGTKCPG